MSPQQKSLRLKKLLGEIITLVVEKGEGDRGDRTFTNVRLIDVGEKCAWVARLGEHAVPVELHRCKEIQVDLEYEGE